MTTRAQSAFETPDLTFLMLIAVWAASAVIIHFGDGFGRLSRRLAKVRPVPIAMLALACCGLFVAATMGRLNTSFLVVVFLAAHWTLAVSKPLLLPISLGVIGGLTWALLHGSLALLGASPRLASIPTFTDLARLIYMSDWNVIHGEPACAEFDSELLYRLRKGVCEFENVEFRNEYRINRLGTRDDESSLDSPRVVALGDSYTLGWGVDGEESFVSLIEEELGFEVLNAGVSSYGTARELALMRRIDRSRLETVILQYCGNDQEENQAYLSGSKLGPKTRAEFDAIVEFHASTRRFHPLRYVYRVYERILAPQAMDALHRVGWPRPNVGGRGEDRGTSEAVADFLNVLKDAPAELANARLLVTSLGSGFGEKSQFLSELKVAVNELGPEDWRSRTEVVDVVAELGAEHYYTLDPHLNSLGHRRVAERLLAKLRAD